MSHEQRMQALATAQQRRSQRSALKRRVATTPYPQSLRLAAQLIACSPAYLASMHVGMLLQSCRHIDAARSRQLLGGMLSTIALGELTPAERRQLVGSIDDWISRAQSSAKERAA